MSKSIKQMENPVSLEVAKNYPKNSSYRTKTDLQNLIVNFNFDKLYLET